MNFKIISYLCLALINDVLSKSVKIIGGSIADISQFPYIVALRSLEPSYVFCTGAIVTNRHVITAGHCIIDRLPDIANMKVFTSTISSVATEGPSYKIHRVDIHPRFRTFTMYGIRHYYDLAVITLSEAIEFTNTQTKVALPTEDSRPGDNAVVAGWGSTTFPMITQSLYLQQTWMKVLDNRVCSFTHPFIVADEQLCAFQRLGVGICTGDSGSPLVSNGVLIGIASFGLPCAQGKSDIYSRVYRLMEFVRTIIPE